jgi:hypothetical protein
MASPFGQFEARIADLQLKKDEPATYPKLPKVIMPATEIT